jgi:hypothetical protein
MTAFDISFAHLPSASKLQHVATQPPVSPIYCKPIQHWTQQAHAVIRHYCSEPSGSQESMRILGAGEAYIKQCARPDTLAYDIPEAYLS